MYRSCIYCSAALGTNEAIERFPVGRSLAFDAAKGRLWAVCPRCARWNLAPLEERWEAIEDAERLFRDTRTRVQRENIGLARLRDGTRLVRVGRALHGELAAWRYGRSMLRRRRGYVAAAGAVAATGAVAAVGTVAAVAVAAASLPVLIYGGQLAVGMYDAAMAGANRLWHAGTDRRVLMRLTAEETGGRPRWLRKGEFRGAFLEWDDAAAGPRVNVPTPTGGLITLQGSRARTALGRSLAIMNVRGTTERQLQGAVRQLGDAGSAERWLQQAARDGLTLELPPNDAEYWERRTAWTGMQGPWVDLARAQRLRVLGDRGYFGANAYLQMRAAALEMALHEETERRALEGELAALQEMWRQAEEIADIADRLPDELAPAPAARG